jgi:hypothetical protein
MLLTTSLEFIYLLCLWLSILPCNFTSWLANSGHITRRKIGRKIKKMPPQKVIVLRIGESNPGLDGTLSWLDELMRASNVSHYTNSDWMVGWTSNCVHNLQGNGVPPVRLANIHNK